MNLSNSNHKKEIIFEVSQSLEDDNWYVAKALDYSIYTQADTLEELIENIKEAIECHFEGEIKPFRLTTKQKGLVLS